MKKGDNFGLISIITNSNRTSTVVAKTRCICFSISVDTLKLIIGENFIDILLLNFVKMGFQKSKVFSSFNTNLIDQAFNNFFLAKFDKSKIVFPIDYETSKNIGVLIEGDLVEVSELYFFRKTPINFLLREEVCFSMKT